MRSHLLALLVPLATILHAGLATESGAATLSLGDSYSCAIDAVGHAECWGANTYGQLGIGSWTRRPFASQVVGLSGVTAIKAGQVQSCAIAEGDLYCWGNNGFGALGSGISPTELPAIAWPISSGPSEGGPPTILAGGAGHMCAIASGTVYCWGLNVHGQLGDGTFQNRDSPVPVNVGSGVPLAIEAGNSHTCAILGYGSVRRVWCWGYNANGQLGNGSLDDSPVPTLVNLAGGLPIAITAGSFHTCTLLGSGTVKCWGSNNQGELGDGAPSDHETMPVPVSFAAGDSATAITAGLFFTCAIMADHGLKCWGWDLNGALGNGPGLGSSSIPTSVQITTSGMTPTEISAGGTHACVRLSGPPDPGIRCWGNNDDGELGDYGVADTEQPGPAVVLGDGLFLGVFD